MQHETCSARGATDRDHNRVSRITAALQREDLSAFVCSLPENVLMLTGYWPVVGNTIGIATREGAIAIVTPEDELEYARRSSWADCVVSFRPASLDCIETPCEAVRNPLLQAFSWVHLSGRATVAVDGVASGDPCSYASMFVYGAAMPALVNWALPSAQITSATAVLERVRSVLTTREIALVRRACAVAGSALSKVALELRPGMSELEVAGLFRNGLMAGERSDGFAYCMSGPNSARAYAAFQRSTERRLTKHDCVLLHCNSYVEGFWTDITRTFVLAGLDDFLHRVFDAVGAATKAAFSEVRPGRRASAVDTAARETLAARGFASEFKHATGHGVGFAAINHNAWPRIHPASSETLESGMVFNIEPAAYFEGVCGVRQCNMALVTETGVECLTSFFNEPSEFEAVNKGGNSES